MKGLEDAYGAIAETGYQQEENWADEDERCGYTLPKVDAGKIDMVNIFMRGPDFERYEKLYPLDLEKTALYKTAWFGASDNKIQYGPLTGPIKWNKDARTDNLVRGIPTDIKRKVYETDSQQLLLFRNLPSRESANYKMDLYVLLEGLDGDTLKSLRQIAFFFSKMDDSTKAAQETKYEDLKVLVTGYGVYVRHSDSLGIIMI